MKTKKLIILVVLILTSHLSWASTEDEEWVSYDSIISELSSSKSSTPNPSASGDPFANVLLHAGVGLATSYVFVSPQEGPRIYGFLRGMEANLGIDLFSRNWMAEGSVRTFGSEEFRQDQEVSLKEFDLKVVYQNALSRKLGFKFSTGLAARYLNYKFRTPNGFEEQNYSTPSALIGMGLKAHITPMVSVGTGIGYRWALIDETIDESAVDANLRLDAHF